MSFNGKVVKVEEEGEEEVEGRPHLITEPAAALITLRRRRRRREKRRRRRRRRRRKEGRGEGGRRGWRREEEGEVLTLSVNLRPHWSH